METELSALETAVGELDLLARVPILMWHHVGEPPNRAVRPYAVSPELLATQLDALVDSGYEAVTFADLREGRRPERPVVLTFDDGYRSFIELAAPLLEERRMRAVAFIVAGAMGRVNDWDRGCEALQLMDEGEIWEIAQRGHEVASHGWRHVRLPEMDPRQLERELSASRVLLEEVTDRPVRSFSYPYGRADTAVIGVVEHCGYDVGCLTWDCREPGWRANLALTRVDVGPSVTPDKLLVHAEENAVDPTPLRQPEIDPLRQLVESTLAAGQGRPPAEAWAAVHKASGPLAAVLRSRGARTSPALLGSVSAMAHSDGQPETAVAVLNAMAPLAPHLAALVDRQGEVPVWGVATPSEAAGVDPEWIRLGPRWSDVARLLWDVEPTDHAEVVAAYLRASGRSDRRMRVASAIDELGAAETAMLTEEALEAETTESWSAVEETLARVRTGAGGASGRARRDEIGDRLSRWDHLRRATTALVRQQLREHYAESFLGLGWTLLRPLLYFSVLVIAFGKVVRVDEPHYPGFLLAGLLPWLFFQTAVGESTSSIRGRGDLLRLAAFPRAALPLATVAASMVDFAAQLLVAIPVIVLIDGPPPLRLLALLPVVAVLIVLVAATALVVAGLTVLFRDLAHFVPLTLFLGFYVVPVFYSSSRLHLPWRAVYLLNPVAVLIETFRSCLHGGPWPPAWTLAAALVIVTAGSVAAWRWFSSASDRFVAKA